MKKLSKIKEKFKSSQALEKLCLVNLYILLTGIFVVASISGGFGITAIVLMILGVLTSCICPCIGLGIVGGAGSIWATLVIINIYIGIITLGIVSVLSPIGLIFALIQKDKIDNRLIYIFIAQLCISWAGLYFVFPLIAVWL